MGRPRAGGWRAADPKLWSMPNPLAPIRNPPGTRAHFGHPVTGCSQPSRWLTGRSHPQKTWRAPPRGWGCPWELEGMTALSCPPQRAPAGSWDVGGAW